AAGWGCEHAAGCSRECAAGWGCEHAARSCPEWAASNRRGPNGVTRSRRRVCTGQLLTRGHARLEQR
ncbi:MAG TPA: hypothetical protein VI197_32030, partial [Polyangiaceae bacterium]